MGTEGMGREKNTVCLLLFMLKCSHSIEEDKYDYIEDPSQDATKRLFLGGSDKKQEGLVKKDFVSQSFYKYDDTLPFGKLDDTEGMTIEQFVNELKRRKEAKKKQNLKIGEKTKGTKNA